MCECNDDQKDFYKRQNGLGWQTDLRRIITSPYKDLEPNDKTCDKGEKGLRCVVGTHKKYSSITFPVYLQDPQATVSRLVEKHVGMPIRQIRSRGALLQDSLDNVKSQIAIITPPEPLLASQEHILNLVRIAAKRYASIQNKDSGNPLCLNLKPLNQTFESDSSINISYRSRITVYRKTYKGNKKIR